MTPAKRGKEREEPTPLDPSGPPATPGVEQGEEGPAPRVFIIAGEHSGDIHAANMFRAMKRLCPGARAQGIGGPEMKAAGVRLHRDIVKDLAIIGFIAVIQKAPQIRELFAITKTAITKAKPDALVLVDYPGFNIRIAEWARRRGTKIVWYISPQVWAWHRSRLYKLARIVHKMLVVFPFEVGLYREEGVDVEHVGHPLFDVIDVSLDREQVCEANGLDPARPVISIVPGSRKKEVKGFLPILLEGARRYHEMDPEAQFAIILAPTISRAAVRRDLERAEVDFPVAIVEECRYSMRKHSDFSWVKSGTSTLEAAILGTPCLIVYRVNYLTWVIGKQIFTIGHIGLPNIVAGDRIVPELLQDEFTPRNLAEKTRHYLANPDEYARMVEDLQDVRKKLGGKGASENAARAVLKVCGIQFPAASPPEQS